MKTLKQIVYDSKCRKGEPDGYTKRGAVWLVPLRDEDKEIQIRSFGGDGVGQNAGDRRNYLRLMHYRNGDIRAVVRYHFWHQNSGSEDSYQTTNILDCETAEDVYTELLNTEYSEMLAVDLYHRQKLMTALVDLGMTKSLPAPDEA